MIFAFLAPTASNILDKDVSHPPTRPAIIGPPLTTTAGILSLTAAITIPGTILSQLGTSTRPSKQCAFAIVSTLSAISSLEAREYFIPTCPIAIPSHTPMEGTIIGVPPASLTPALTASVILSRLMCPGTISLCAETTPIRGLSSSSFVNPQAYNNDLWGAVSTPLVKYLLLKAIIITSYIINLKPFIKNGLEKDYIRSRLALGKTT